MLFSKFGLFCLSLMLFVTVAFSADKNSSFGGTDAFGKGKSDSFGKSDTFGNDKKESQKVEEVLKKDPKKAKSLRKKSRELAKLAAQARRFKDAETAKKCSSLSQSLAILADFHEDKKEQDKKNPKNKAKTEKKPSKTPEEANRDCKKVDQQIKQLRLKVSFARYKTPEGKKQRKFQLGARNYYRKAKNSVRRGRKSEAEYYTICGKILDNAAKNYKDKNIEESCKNQLREARNKYLEKSTLESAARFEKRANSMRKINDTERAQYYDKVATLKKKMAKAYGKGNTKEVKSLWKEYQELKKNK